MRTVPMSGNAGTETTGCAVGLLRREKATDAHSKISSDRTQLYVQPEGNHRACTNVRHHPTPPPIRTKRKEITFWPG